jgi:hypothetical protein
MGNPTAFRDDSQARTGEVPTASWVNGVNWGGSCAPGIGINYGEGAVVGTPAQFTLLDQTGAARDPQASAQIGFEDGDSTRQGTNAANGDGTVTPVANVALISLAAGWVDEI